MMAEKAMSTNNFTLTPESSPKLFVVPNSDHLTDNEFSLLYQLCSSERRLRVNRFHFREDACRSVIGETLMRYAVFSVTKELPRADAFTTNRNGKPALHGTNLHLNISHSGKWVVCGIDTMDIGVDIEKIREISLELTRYFSPEEKVFLKSFACKKHLAEMFFRIWTLKESYIKSIGEGLLCPLDSFACIPVKGDTVEFKRFDSRLPLRYLRNFSIDPSYSSAVCTTGIFGELPVSIIGVSDLLRELNE
ncbi:4'-phosphopantetheinyl transferase [Chitinispirillum alkaliphilum]|nr:4'-phosphopantetheinyl transferase [Chitinispirillum alkaliphilum]